MSLQVSECPRRFYRRPLSTLSPKQLQRYLTEHKRLGVLERRREILLRNLAKVERDLIEQRTIRSKARQGIK